MDEVQHQNNQLYPTEMNNIAEKIHEIHQRIQHSAAQAERNARDIQLLAVSKTQAPARILEAYHAGQRAFGENYLQEARDKQQALRQLDIEWHFIGPIQSNKTRDIAAHFYWVHSVDRLKIAERLSKQRPQELPPLNICLQLNIDNENTKSGTTIEELPSLANAINILPNLTLRGLMVIPEKRDTLQAQQQIFEKVANTLQHVSLGNPTLQLDTLSMGMSDDMEAAIAAGATIIRVGSAIFGSRQ